ncbi:MAG: hypothetical protein JWL65_959 [Gammaproteobacteria bacterium]|nr:hypothetical protein [Gammaproteobacteria bacterium]
MLCNLYLRSSKNDGLEATAARLFEILDIRPLVMRRSENYPGGKYMPGRVLGLSVKLAIADDSEFPAYQYWMNFTPLTDPARVDRHGLDGLGELLGKELSTRGFDVALALEFGKIGGKKLLFESRKP